MQQSTSSFFGIRRFRRCSGCMQFESSKARPLVIVVVSYAAAAAAAVVRDQSWFFSGGNDQHPLKMSNGEETSSVHHPVPGQDEEATAGPGPAVVQDILEDSLTSLGIGSSKCYLGEKAASSSCMSLPALGGGPSRFRSKIPVPSKSQAPELAPKPAFKPGGFTSRGGKASAGLNTKEPLRREMSLPPASGLLANQHIARSCLDLKPPMGPSSMMVQSSSNPRTRPPYSRSNSSVSLYRGLAMGSAAARRGSIDAAAASGQAAQPQQLSKIPVWSGSQEKINQLRAEGPTHQATAAADHHKNGGQTRFATQRRKWESCSNLEVGTTLSYFSRRYRKFRKKWPPIFSPLNMHCK